MANIPRLISQITESGLDALLLAGRKNTLYLRSDLLFRDAMYNSTNDGWILMFCVIVPPDQSFSVGARGLDLPDLPTEAYGTDDYVNDYLTVVIEQLKNRGLVKGRIGLDAGVTPEMLFKLRSAMSDAEFVDGEPVMVRTRTVKTDREISCIEKAVEIAEQAFEDSRHAVASANSWREAGTILAQAVIAHGAAPHQINPFDFVCRDFAHSPARDRPPSGGAKPDAMGREGDGLTRWPDPNAPPSSTGTTRVDWNICYQGYVSDFKTPICVGEPARHAVKTIVEHAERIEFMYKTVSVGKTKAEVFEACRNEFKAETSDAPLWLVHGVGMDVHEEPRMSSAYPTGHARTAPDIKFEVGNVLSLEGSWLVEELTVLTSDGLRRIGSIKSREINVLA